MSKKLNFFNKKNINLYYIVLLILLLFVVIGIFLIFYRLYSFYEFNSLKELYNIFLSSEKVSFNDFVNKWNLYVSNLSSFQKTENINKISYNYEYLTFQINNLKITGFWETIDPSIREQFNNNIQIYKNLASLKFVQANSMYFWSGVFLVCTSLLSISYPTYKIFLLSKKNRKENEIKKSKSNKKTKKSDTRASKK